MYTSISWAWTVICSSYIKQITKYQDCLFIPITCCSKDRKINMDSLLYPQRMAGTIGSEWHGSTFSKETTRPDQTPQSTKDQPIT